MPSNQSRPSASKGASPATTAAARTRSGSSAAAASTSGPPPDTPAVANRPSSKWSATVCVSTANEPTRSPGSREDSVAGPVVRDDAQAMGCRVVDDLLLQPPAQRRAVVEDERRTVRDAAVKARIVRPSGVRMRCTV